MNWSYWLGSYTGCPGSHYPARGVLNLGCSDSNFTVFSFTIQLIRAPLGPAVLSLVERLSSFRGDFL